MMNQTYLSVCSCCWASCWHCLSLIHCELVVHCFFFSFPVKYFKPQNWIPNCLLLARDSQSAVWRSRRNDGFFNLGVMHRQSDKMCLAGGSVFLLLASLITSCTSGALWASPGGNRTLNGTVEDGGFVPVVFTKVSQIIAREGSCVLIDCNITGEPLPSVQWFNSHGERLDTDSNGETDCTVTFNLVPCSVGHKHCTSHNYSLISSKFRRRSG